MSNDLKFKLFAGASVVSLVVGAVWMNDQATYLGGALLLFGFIGSVLSFVSFRNKPNKIYTQYAGLVRFYEPWELTNISFKESKLYKPSFKKVSKVEDDIFKVGERRLQNLEFRRKQIEKLIHNELEKLKQTNTNNPKK